MAAAVDVAELREQLRSPEAIKASPFQVLKAISVLLNDDEQENVAREMVLRALENQTAFGAAGAILGTLARTVGLFPYADPDALSLPELLAYEFHRPLNMSGDLVFHRQQADVYRRLLAGENVILSAPTSFGKSRIIDAMISSGKYRNIAVVVPTLALIDETRRRLAEFSN